MDPTNIVLRARQAFSGAARVMAYSGTIRARSLDLGSVIPLNAARTPIDILMGPTIFSVIKMRNTREALEGAHANWLNPICLRDDA